MHETKLHWWSFDPDDGFKLHATEREARDEAAQSLNMWRSLARSDGEWSSEVEYVRWGRVCGEMEAVTIEDEHTGNVSGDYWLKDVKESR